MTEIQNPKHEYDLQFMKNQNNLHPNYMFRSRAAQALAPRVEY